MILPAPLSIDPLAEHEESEGVERVGQGHGRAVTVADDLAHGGPLAAAIPGGHQPVEGRGEHVLPLVPDRGEAVVEGGPGLTHGVLGVGAGAEGLADHDPPGEFSLAEEIAAAGADLPRDPQPEGRAAHEIDDQHRPIPDAEARTLAAHREVILLLDLEETHRSEDPGVVADAHFQAVAARRAESR